MKGCVLKLRNVAVKKSFDVTSKSVFIGFLSNEKKANHLIYIINKKKICAFQCDKEKRMFWHVHKLHLLPTSYTCCYKLHLLLQATPEATSFTPSFKLHLSLT